MSEENKFRKFMTVEKQRKESLDAKNITNAVLDRSFLSLFSYQYAVEQMSLVGDSYTTPEYISDNIITPDIVIHLDVDLEVRKARVKQRGFDVYETLLDKAYNDRIKEYYEFHKQDISYLSIDTTDMSPEDVLKEVMAFIEANNQTIENKPEKYSGITNFIKYPPEARKTYRYNL